MSPALSAVLPPNSQRWRLAQPLQTQSRRACPRKPGRRTRSYFPQPRIAVGLALLRRRLATAAIDLSDGLSTDLTHLCRESGVGAEISAAALPIHPLAIPAGPDRSLALALNGGEDYELLFAAPPNLRLPRTIAGVRITRIGRLVRGATISIVDSPVTRRH
jgi:thiamine-monophosphate kinase